MKITCLFLMIALVQVSASTYSQSAKLTFRLNNVMLSDVFEQIEKNSEFRFFYDSGDIDFSKKITIDADNSNVEEILNKVFKGANVSYEIFDRYIIVKATGKESNSEKRILLLQQKGVSGKVTDSSGAPLPGVTIAIKGKSEGTITDAEGKYSISRIGSDAILQFSFVGMKTQEVAVENRVNINITMQEEAIGLEEVVAIGYGTMKKSDLTGSITSVKSEDIKGLAVRSVTEALQGRVAGVMINKSSGKPGASSQIIIRGAGSVNGLDPLYVIDGVAMSNSTTFNPKDVESIEIIKDASAAAIYGARAAGGVVLITTKKGTYGQKTDYTFTANTGIRMISDSYKMLETEDYITARKAFGEDYSIWNNLEELPNTNWFDELFGTGIEQSYLFSMRGGKDKMKYYLSAGYEKEEGIQKNNYWERFSLRFNNDYKLTNRLTIGHQLYLTRVKENPATVNIPWRTLPYMAVYEEDGAYASVPSEVEFSGGNPVAELAYKHFKSRDLGANVIFYADWEVLNGLHIKTTGAGIFGSGYDDQFTEENNLKRTYEAETYTKSSSYSESYTWTTTLTYAKIFAEMHDFRIMAGYEVKDSHSSSLSAKATDFPVDVAESFALSTNNNKTASGSLGYGKYLSQFGRLTYVYDNRYLLTANIRRDGSPKFGPNNRWGVFPSVSVGWKIQEEDFFKGLNLNFISALKPRVSWGILGNDTAIDNFAYIPSYKQVNLHSYDGTSSIGGYNSVKVVNEDIKWEEIHTVDVGLDLSMFKNTLSASAEYYRRETQDMIYDLTIPLSAGISSYGSASAGSMPVNLGSIMNKGWELSVSYRNSIGNVNYSVAGNVSHNKNEVINLGVSAAYLYDGGAWPMSDYSSPFKTVNGQPMGMLYGYIVDGLIQSDEEMEKLNENAVANGASYYHKQYTGAGDLKYRDIDGDGTITSSDRTFIGNPWPKYQYGFNLMLDWKGIDFAVDIVGIAGRDVMNDVKGFEHTFHQDYQSTYKIFEASYFLGNGLTSNPRIGTLEEGAFIEDPNYNYKYYSSYFVEDGSYLKVKNITIGYTIPSRILSRLGLSKFRIYASGQNLLTFTKFTGLDPEFSNNETEYGQYNISTYPQTKLISFGVDLNF